MPRCLLVTRNHQLTCIQSSLIKMDQWNLGNGSDKQIELKLDGIEIKPCIKGRNILSFTNVQFGPLHMGTQVRGPWNRVPTSPADMTTLHKGGTRAGNSPEWRDHICSPPCPQGYRLPIDSMMKMTDIGVFLTQLSEFSTNKAIFNELY